MIHYIVPIVGLLLPILISCCIALFIPVSPRLKWMGSLRNALYILITIGLTIILILTLIAARALHQGCFCRVKILLFPTLIYFILWFSLLSTACRQAKFKCFKNNGTFIATIIMSTIITISPAVFNNLANGCVCTSIGTRVFLLIYLTLIIISQVIYKKALGKQNKK